MEKTWTNYGDVNPIEHGGMWVSHDTEIQGRNYYVIQSEMLHDGTFQVIDAYVDLDDSWIEWDSVKSTMDTSNDASDESLAVDLVRYYGTHCSHGEILTFDSEEDLRTFLSKKNIVVE